MYIYAYIYIYMCVCANEAFSPQKAMSALPSREIVLWKRALDIYINEELFKIYMNTIYELGIDIVMLIAIWKRALASLI